MRVRVRVGARRRPLSSPCVPFRVSFRVPLRPLAFPRSGWEQAAQREPPTPRALLPPPRALPPPARPRHPAPRHTDARWRMQQQQAEQRQLEQWQQANPNPNPNPNPNLTLT